MRETPTLPQDTLARLRREALAMGALQHPHIVQVTSFSEGPPGIVQRDVKLANVFVMETPLTDVFVKLLDFGVAKLLTPQSPALTSLDAIIGSAPYMAPEQIRGEPVDGKTDLFALGVTLYEMLAGRRPFVAAPGE